MARIQPRWDMMIVTGSRSIMASSGISRAGPVSLQARAPFAGGGLRPVALAQGHKVFLELLLLQLFVTDQQQQLFALGGERRMFLAQFHFLKTPQTAQPHVEDRLDLPVGEAEFGHHQRLGFVFRPDDSRSPDRD